MSQQERLAALLAAEIGDGRLRLGKRSIRELAARLLAAGVHLDDGLRAACVECAEPSHDEDLHDHHYVDGVVHIGPPCAAALEPR